MGLQYAARARRLAREGSLVPAKLVGEPGAWCSELIPWRGAKRLWRLVLEQYGRVLPTVQQHAELEGDKVQLIHALRFLDESPVRDEAGRVLVLCREGKVWSFPSPWVVSLRDDDPDRDGWQQLLTESMEPEVVAG